MSVDPALLYQALLAAGGLGAVYGAAHFLTWRTGNILACALGLYALIMAVMMTVGPFPARWHTVAFVGGLFAATGAGYYQGWNRRLRERATAAEGTRRP